jgi:cell division protein FtsA
MEEIVELVYAEIQRLGFHDKLAAGIVLTGGGSQLQNLVQLAEYVTGMDTRIGYPNEHLGKSKIEAVKSPMYATTVGLVLAGYRSIDDRLAQRPYDEPEQNQYRSTPENRPTVVATPQPVVQQPAPAAPAPQPVAEQPKKSSGAGDFFQKIISRTKGLLIDDFDDKQY